jgi:hypothetical protein
LLTPEHGMFPKSVKMTQAYWDRVTNSAFALKKDLTKEEKMIGYFGVFEGIPVEIDNSISAMGRNFEFQY